MNMVELILLHFFIQQLEKLIYFKQEFKLVYMIQLGIYILYNYSNGYLREKDLENYIFELIPTFP